MGSPLGLAGAHTPPDYETTHVEFGPLLIVTDLGVRSNRRNTASVNRRCSAYIHCTHTCIVGMYLKSRCCARSARLVPVSPPAVADNNIADDAALATADPTGRVTLIPALVPKPCHDFNARPDINSALYPRIFVPVCMYVHGIATQLSDMMLGTKKTLRRPGAVPAGDGRPEPFLSSGFILHVGLCRPSQGRKSRCFGGLPRLHGYKCQDNVHRSHGRPEPRWPSMQCLWYRPGPSSLAGHL
jgi:hypothetical protein